MFNALSEKLESAFKHLKGQSRINELNVANTLKDIRKALLDADVNFKIAKEFTDTIKEKAVGEKVINAISPGQLMVKIVQDELTALMGSEASLLDTSKNPTIILVAGLQGSGKTTFSGKLATYLKAQKKSPLLVAADIYRPAAMDQLTVLAEEFRAYMLSNGKMKIEDRTQSNIFKRIFNFLLDLFGFADLQSFDANQDARRIDQRTRKLGSCGDFGADLSGDRNCRNHPRRDRSQ